MAITTSLKGTVTIVDSSVGTVSYSKNVSITFVGTVGTTGQNVLIGVAPVTIPLPVSPTQFVYIKNLHASQTVTVTWTPNGGASNVVATIEPGSALLLLEAAAGGGITALSLVASGASTPVEYVLVG